MVRVRLGHLALAIVIAAAWLVPIGMTVVPVARAAAVGWPTSTLVVSEVQTGGASASDEFVEVANQGAGAVDLAGLEVVYATSSGSTVTRKATWSASTVLDPGKADPARERRGRVRGARRRHLCRRVRRDRRRASRCGSSAARVIDSVGWGDATNELRRGLAGTCAGRRVEPRAGAGRRCSATGGTRTTASVDWFVQTVPSPQGLAAPPVPAIAPAARPRRRPRRRRRRPTPVGEPTPDPDRHADCPRRRPTPTPTPDPDPDTDSHSHAHTHAGPDPDAHAHPDADADADAHPDIRPGCGPRHGTSAADRDGGHGPGDRDRGSRPARNARAHRGRGRDRRHRGAAAVRRRSAGAGHARPSHGGRRRAVRPARAPARRRRRHRRGWGCAP